MTKIIFSENVAHRPISRGDWFVSDNDIDQEKTLWQLVQTCVNEVQLISVIVGNRKSVPVRVCTADRLTEKEFAIVSSGLVNLVQVSVEITVSRNV